MSQKMEEKDQKIHNPQAEFNKPTDVLKDPELSKTDKKKALENLEQDAHQLIRPAMKEWSQKTMTPQNTSRSWMRSSKRSSGLAKSHKTSRLNEVSDDDRETSPSAAPRPGEGRRASLKRPKLSNGLSALRYYLLGLPHRDEFVGPYARLPHNCRGEVR